MRITKDKCDEDFVKKELTIFVEKCKSCNYLKTCPYVGKRIKVLTEKGD